MIIYISLVNLSKLHLTKQNNNPFNIYLEAPIVSEEHC